MNGGNGPSGFSWRGLVLPVLLLALFEALSLAGDGTSEVLAPPSAIALAGVQAILDGTLFNLTLATLATALTGLAIGGATGLTLGLAFGLVPVLDWIAKLTIEAIRPIPSVALIPIALLIFGFGYRLEIAVVAFATIWPVMIITRDAVKGIEPMLAEVANVLRLSAFARITKIVLPATVPALFVALRLGSGIALIVAVTVEISANPIGLGSGMMQAQQSLHPDLMLALLVWIGILGFTLNVALLHVERRFFARMRP